ncbi:MAG: RNA polymerase sigma factor [Acidobacteria bacterium]|nr:RNA polymerase sigma factor [Acidobacteriota bacterium]
MDAAELSSLIEACRAGDALAWETFVRQYQGRLFALAYSYVGNREDARDLAQEIFVKLYEVRVQWVAGDEFLPWVFRVARNRSIDFLRRRKVRTPALAVDEHDLADLADQSPSAEAQSITADRRSLLRAALRSLSAINREIVVLRDVHGLSIQHVASMLGIPAGTVKSRASRARVELAERVLALTRDRGEA